MAKFKMEEKIKIVLRYLEGQESYKQIGDEQKVSPSVIHEWVKLYEQQGVEAFMKPYTNYPMEFKLKVLNYMIELGASSGDAAGVFNVSSGMIRSWRRAYETGGMEGLKTKKKGQLSMKKKSNSNNKESQPVEGSIESLRAENERLRMENAYLKKLNALIQEQEKLQTKSKRK